MRWSFSATAYRRGLACPNRAEEAARYYDEALASGATRSPWSGAPSSISTTSAAAATGCAPWRSSRAPPISVTPRRWTCSGASTNTEPTSPRTPRCRALDRAAPARLGLCPGLIDLGELYASAPPPFGSPDKAYAAYQRAWQEGSSEAGLRLGRILRSRGQLPEAKAMFRRRSTAAAASRPSSWPALAFAEGGAPAPRRAASSTAPSTSLARIPIPPSPLPRRCSRFPTRRWRSAASSF